MKNGTITLTGLCKEYVPKTLIKNLDLRISPGELVGVVGPSGVGKTTFLRLVARLEAPSSGEVLAHGRVGYVFQNPRLLPWRTALDNIAIVIQETFSHHSMQSAREEARVWLEKTELQDAAGQYPGALSGGMAQRVGLARALAVRPSILLLDEPFSSLDAERRLRMRNLVTHTMAENPEMSALYVTHQPADIGALARHILHLEPQATWRVETFHPEPIQPA